jgi:Leucine-rich repeat (LRR) protein
MNGRYQRRRERRELAQLIYDEIDSWNEKKINAILSEAKKDKVLAQQLTDYYLLLLKAINPHVPYGLEHLRELPEYISGLKNIRRSSQSEFYFKLVGFYLLKKKISLVKEFIYNYPPEKVNTLGYCDENVAVTLMGIMLYEKLVAEAEELEAQILPNLPNLNILNLSFLSDSPKRPIFMPLQAKIAARHVQNMSSLTINNADQLQYFEPSELVGLKYFYAAAVSLKAIIPFLSQLPNIEEIRCIELANTDNLELLACRSLKKLSLEGIFRYSTQPKLPEKSLELPHLLHLEQLRITYDNIVDIDKIAHLTKLKYLYINSSGQLKNKNLDVIGHFTQLEELYMTEMGIEDISVFGRKNNFPKLRNLSLVKNNLKNIAPLSALTALSYLVLSMNKITDISPLSSLKNLSDVNLYDNQISDISPLAGLNSELIVHAAKNKLDVCPPFELIRRVLARDKNAVAANKSLKKSNKKTNSQLYILCARPEPPNAAQIWQLLRSKDPANTELALQLAKGLGWTDDDIQPYTHIIKKWL